MTREELIASLTDLKDYSIIPDDAREKLHMCVCQVKMLAKGRQKGEHH